MLSWIIHTFRIVKWSFLPPTFLILKSSLSDLNIATSTFLQFVSWCYILFHSIILKLCLLKHQSLHVCCCCCCVASVVSNSVRPQRRQPTRLPRSWDSPGNNTGVGCHFLLQCMKVKSESEVAQSRLTLSDPMDCGLPGSSVHGIFQARVLEWGAVAFFMWYFASPQKCKINSLIANIQ